MLKRLSLLLGTVLVLLSGTMAMAQDPAAPQETAPGMSTPTELYDQGLRVYRNRNYGRAVELFRQVIELDPDHAEAHYLIGYSLVMLRQYPAAVEAFGTAFEKDPELDPRTIYQRPR